MPAPIYVKSISTEYVEKITEIMNHAAKNISIRARIVLLSNQGYTVPEIVPQVNRHHNIVRHWIHAFNKIELDIFRHQNTGKGRPSSFDAHLDNIVKIALSKPRQLGLSFTKWSLTRLRDYLLTKEGISISRERLRQLLATRDIAFHKAKDWIHSNDPEYQQKKDDVLSLYNSSSGVVLCFDEKGTIAVKDYGAGQWGTEAPRHLLKYKTRGTTELFASYNPKTGEVLCEFFEKKRPHKLSPSLSIFVRSTKEIM